MTKMLTIAVTTLLLWFHRSDAVVVFETFDPGDPIDPYTGYTPGWNVLTEYGKAMAAQFTIDGPGYFLNSITLSLGYVQDTSKMSVSLVEDAGNVPGDNVLENVIATLAAVTNFQQVVTFESSLKPFLADGGKYWVVIAPPAQNHTTMEDNAVYNWHGTGVIGLIGIRDFNFDTASWYGWNVYGGGSSQLPAFRIEGIVVPEPSSIWLLAGGLSLFGAWRWRRKKELSRPTFASGLLIR